MDNKTLVSQLSKESGLDTSRISAMVEAVSTTLRDCCADLDAVAIPGFGTFQPVKRDERVETDDSGRRTLLPPDIKVEFKSSVLLRKSLS